MICKSSLLPEQQDKALTPRKTPDLVFEQSSAYNI